MSLSHRIVILLKLPSHPMDLSTIHRRLYRLSFRPSWSVATLLLQRAGMIGSICRFLRAFRILLLSYPRSAMSRSGLVRGRPGPERFTLTVSSVFSRSLTSDGDAESRYAPSGVPAPSTSTIHFVPFPRLVLPT